MDEETNMECLNNLITLPELHDILAILKGARNGFVYGVKVRFPHALIMAILFGRGDWNARASVILSTTKQHAFSLAKFVSIYKIILLIRKNNNYGKERNIDTFLAGLIGGYFVFGDRTAINEQIVLYVVSRVLASFLPRLNHPYNASPSPLRPIPSDGRYFTVFASLTWGAVMYLFRHRGHTLQPGMFHAMTYLYRDSETWDDLRTLLWHNS